MRVRNPIAFIAAILLAAISQTTIGAVVSVNTTDDEFGNGANCSLREAVRSVNDQSDFGGCTHTGTYGNDDAIELYAIDAIEVTRSNSTENNDATWNDIDLLNPVTIESGRGNPYTSRVVPGPGYDGSALDNRITSGAGLTIRNVTIAGFRSPSVKAALSGNPVTTIEQSIFRENRTTGEFSEGAAVYNYGGVVNISRSSFIRNSTADSDGGAVAAARVDVDNSTFVYNSAGQDNSREGGAIYITDTTLPGSEVSELDNVTITQNSASGEGGGIYVDEKDLRVRNSILAHNRAAGGGPECALSSGAGLVGSHSAYNLVFDDAGCGVGGLNSSLNIVGEPARLAAIAPATGRHTPVQLPLHDSPAIDAGDCTDGTGSPLGNDQRSMGRPASGCDVGAVEKVWEVFTVDSEADTRDADTTDDTCADSSGNCSLRAAIDQANATVHPQEIILPAGTYTLTRDGTDENSNATGDLDVDAAEPLIVNGAGADTTIIDAAGMDRVIHANSHLWLRDLRLTGGDTTAVSTRSEGGGILAADANDTLNLKGVSVAGNRTEGGHGGGIYAAARLRMIESTLRDNEANGTGWNGGGLYLLGDGRRIGGAWIENTSIVGNTAASTGGGINQRDYSGLHLEHVTVAGNASQDAQQIRVEASSGNPRLTAHNTIVAGSGIDCVTAGSDAAIASRGYNLESGSTCGFGQSSDQQTTAPNLAPLADAGGPLQLREPNAGAPVVDQGQCIDANGRLLPGTVFGGTRPQNADGPSAGDTGDANYNCDIGAAERQQVQFEAGANNPDARSVNAGSTGVVMAQIELTNESGGAVYGTTLTLRHLGTGDPAADITSVKLYLDEDDDGELDATDTELASTSYDSASETVTFDPFLLVGIVPADPVNLLVVYDFSDTLARNASPSSHTAAGMGAIGGLLLPLLCLAGRRRHIFLALPAALVLTACGGGGGGGGPGSDSDSGAQGETFQIELEKAGTLANNGDDLSLRVKPVRGNTVTVQE